MIKAAKELAMPIPDNTPSKPVCNNVLTEPVGEIYVIGKLVPAVECEQIIALPVDNKVELKFKEMKINCEIGATLTFIDGVTNEETAVCNQLTENKWVSSANIVVIRFEAAIEGQGYSASYKSVPRDDYIPACSRLVTSAEGKISSTMYPASPSTYPDDNCELFIVGTPGKNIQFIFDTFLTSGDLNSCSKDVSVVVVDMEGGEEDMFCGELRPFIWESRGSRVRLVYSAGNIFTGTYSFVDI